MRWTDWVLLACAAALLLLGPSMALQELARAEEEKAYVALTQELPPRDFSYRGLWYVPVLGLVLVVGVVGTFAVVRILRQPRVRAVSGRLLALLMGGMTLLDFAYMIDVQVFPEAPHVARATTIVWFYTLAGVLVAGSVLRLSEVESVFSGEARRDVVDDEPASRAH